MARITLISKAHELQACNDEGLGWAINVWENDSPDWADPLTYMTVHPFGLDHEQMITIAEEYGLDERMRKKLGELGKWCLDCYLFGSYQTLEDDTGDQA